MFTLCAFSFICVCVCVDFTYSFSLALDICSLFSGNYFTICTFVGRMNGDVTKLWLKPKEVDRKYPHADNKRMANEKDNFLSLSVAGKIAGTGCFLKKELCDLLKPLENIQFHNFVRIILWASMFVWKSALLFFSPCVAMPVCSVCFMDNFRCCWYCLIK